MRRWLVLAVVLFLALVANPAWAASRTYTTDADFDSGTYSQVVKSPSGSLALSETVQAFNAVWVAVSTKGTIVRIDPATGAIVGEYWTSPDLQPRNPSRTTVDKNGTVWAANRDGNSVVHVGVKEAGQCLDRNNNGTIDTSSGLDDIRAWPNEDEANTDGGVTNAADECILHYIRVTATGTRHISVTPDNDIWVSGTGVNNGTFDLIDGATGTIVRTEGPVGYGGYGGLVDDNGFLWSTAPLLRWDTSLPLSGENGVNWLGYDAVGSYGICINRQNGDVWVTNGGEITRINSAGVVQGAPLPNGSPVGFAQGCAVDGNGHVWVAHSLFGDTVGHLLPDGTFVGNVTVPAGPTGISVDASGKVWSANLTGQNASRIDPALGEVGADGVTKIGAVDLTTADLGGQPYNYSDMTGAALPGKPSTGTWTVTYDSGVDASEWGILDWNGAFPAGSAVEVQVQSSANGTDFSTPVTATKASDVTLANGRYLKIVVTFTRAGSGASPVLDDLTVSTAPPDVVVPEAPMAVLLPLSGLAIAAAYLAIRRRQVRIA